MRRIATLGILTASLLASPGPAGAGFFRTLVDPLDQHKKLFSSGKYGEVIAKLSPEAMQKLRKGDLQRAYFYLAASYERTGQPDKALGVYQLGARLYPRDIDLLTPLASLLHHMGLEEQAEPLFQRVLQIHPNNAEAHLGLGEIDHALGFLDRSAEHYDKALDTLGDQGPVWRDYAEVLLAARDYKTAELAIRKAIELSPETPARVDLAFIQRASGRLEEALKTLDDVLAQAPSTEIALTRALWLLEAGRYEEALPPAEAALKISPDDALALWIRARVHLKADRYNQAVKDLEAAAKAERRAPFVAQAAAEMLSQLKGRR